MAAALEDVPSLLVGAAETAIKQLATEAIEDRLRWTVSDPTPGSGDLYRVSATATVQVNADLPVVGERTYLATLPFRFEVDVKDKAVVSWTPLFDAGRIEESTQ